MNVDRVYAVFRFVCSIAKVFDDPKTSKTLEKYLHKGEDAAEKIEKRVDFFGEPKPGFIERKLDDAKEKAKSAATGVVVQQATAKVEDAKKEAVETAVEAKKEVTKKADLATTAITNLGTKIGSGAAVVGHGVVEAGRNARENLAEARQDILKKQAETAAYGPNEECPSCGHKRKLNPHNSRPIGCRNCFREFFPQDAIARFQRERRF